MHTIEHSGVRFSIPDTWTIETDVLLDGWAASLQSEGTAFMVVSLFEEADDPAALVDQSLEEMRKTYPDLEAESVVEPIAGQPAVGYDIGFFTLDLSNTCSLRAIQAPEGGLLILSQVTDNESAVFEPEMRAIRASIEVEDG